MAEEHCPKKETCPHVQDARKNARTWFKQMQFYRDRLLVETARREKSELMLLHDPLTGALNRRGLEKNFLEECSKTKRFGRKLFLVFLDIDNFRAFNNEHGEHTGDLVLQKAVECIAAGLRPYDSIYRLGGEEFVVLLPEIRSVSTACRLAERIRKMVAGLKVVPHDDSEPLGVTVSVGLARLGSGDSLDTLVDKANEAEQEAKKRGKDRTYIYLGGEVLPAEKLIRK